MRQRTRSFAFFLLVAIGVASQYAQAAHLSVNCDKHESISKVLRLLAKTNPQGPNGKPGDSEYGSTDTDHRNWGLNLRSLRRELSGRGY